MITVKLSQTACKRLSYEAMGQAKNSEKKYSEINFFYLNFEVQKRIMPTIQRLILRNYIYVKEYASLSRGRV